MAMRFCQLLHHDTLIIIAIIIIIIIIIKSSAVHFKRPWVWDSMSRCRELAQRHASPARAAPTDLLLSSSAPVPASVLRDRVGGGDPLEARLAVSPTLLLLL